MGRRGFVTIFVSYLCFADVGTKISPKPVLPHNPPLHLYGGVGATQINVALKGFKKLWACPYLGLAGVGTAIFY